MSAQYMIYRQYTPELERVDKIVVDGNRCGAGLQLSHWPGNRTPAALKADLSLEIVLRLLASEEARARVAKLDWVTNDHFDTDGVLAVWTLLHPGEALDHAPALRAAAEAGDFYEFTSPEAVQFDLIARAFESRENSPVAAEVGSQCVAARWQLATEALLAEMPGLLYQPERYRNLWEEPYGKLLDDISWVESGAVEVREYPAEHLTVISSPRPLNHFTRNVAARGHRILECVTTREGATYELYYRELLWYDIVWRPRAPRHLLTHAAEVLNELESHDTCGAWGWTRWSPALRFVAAGARLARRVEYHEPLGDSSLPLDVVERVIRAELHRLDAFPAATI